METVRKCTSNPFKLVVCTGAVLVGATALKKGINAYYESVDDTPHKPTANSELVKCYKNLTTTECDDIGYLFSMYGKARDVRNLHMQKSLIEHDNCNDMYTNKIARETKVRMLNSAKDAMLCSKQLNQMVKFVFESGQSNQMEKQQVQKYLSELSLLYARKYIGTSDRGQGITGIAKCELELAGLDGSAAGLLGAKNYIEARYGKYIANLLDNSFIGDVDSNGSWSEWYNGSGNNLSDTF